MALLAFQRPQPPHALPRAPQTIEESGLPPGFLVELVGKVMLQHGLSRLAALSAHLCLSGALVDAVCQFMRRESLVEVGRRGASESDIHYELTQAGRARAADALARNSYTGPAPVTLEAYAERVAAQSVADRTVPAARVREAFAGIAVPPELLDRLGTAVNSGRPALLYGPSGVGKSWLARHLRRIVDGPVAIPHAILVHGEVIRVHDPQVHVALPADATPRGALDARERADARWVTCERPCVVSGGELTLEMLDLSFDGRTGYYEAPPHFKANNGLFIVDDLGRQVVTPRQLMNRWVVPMEQRHDHLMLRNGAKFTIPFDMVLVFSSNLTPAELDDDAFLRRLGHKVEVGPLPAGLYREVFEQACVREGIAFDATAFDHLLAEHRRHDLPLLACCPGDVLHLIASRARYLGVPADLSAESLDWARRAYFGHATPGAAAATDGTQP